MKVQFLVIVEVSAAGIATTTAVVEEAASWLIHSGGKEREKAAGREG